MIEVPVYNQDGVEIEKLSVDPARLAGGGQVNAALLKQAIVYFQAAQRQGTVRTKRRGEVAGSTRKLYKQKGTGNARTGGIRNPIKVGGGHAKQKTPKEWRLDMPVKQRRLARQHALLAKLQDGGVKVLDKLELPEAKTKLMAGVLGKLGVDRSCLLATDGHNEALYRATRNIDRTTVTTVAQLNAYDVLKNRVVVMTKSGFEGLITK